jgi:hypothetical protein
VYQLQTWRECGQANVKKSDNDATICEALCQSWGESGQRQAEEAGGRQESDQAHDENNDAVRDHEEEGRPTQDRHARGGIPLDASKKGGGLLAAHVGCDCRARHGGRRGCRRRGATALGSRDP